MTPKTAESQCYKTVKAQQMFERTNGVKEICVETQVETTKVLRAGPSVWLQFDTAHAKQTVEKCNKGVT